MKSRKKNNLFIILFLLILGIGLGYALLSQDLTINGTTKVKGNNWNIYFDNIQITDGSVTLSAGDKDADLAENSDTVVEYIITLNQPGDFYEFTVDAVNDGTVDAMIGKIVSKLNNTVISTTNPIPAYLIYSVTYSDGIPIANNHILAANSSETYKVRVEFKRDIEESELPTTDQTNEFSFEISYVQADDTAQAIPRPINFAEDSWATIIAAIKTGNTSSYHVGDTKTVILGNDLGTHTIRIANKSTPTACETEDFSQTACGFVLEFADIITTHKMNSTATNIGGWPASEMRTYINTDIYNSLPTELKNSIINTKVLSGSGTDDLSIFESTDKLYLLTFTETEGMSMQGDYVSTVYTRRLDYYSENMNQSDRIKKYNNTATNWWKRSARKTTNDKFWFQRYNGDPDDWDSANMNYGVSPAFRIG